MSWIPYLYKYRFARILLSLLCGMMLSVPNALGQNELPCKDTLSVKVYFPQGVSSIIPSFRDNRFQMAAFQARLKGLQNNNAKVTSIIVKTSASPEGGSLRNKELSELRAQSIQKWLLGIEGIDPSLLTIVPVGEDWEGLATRLRSLDQPWRDGALSIVLNTPEWVTKNGIVVDSRKKRLMDYQGGQVWFYLEEHVFPDLRQAGGEISCIFEYEPTLIVQTVRDTVSIQQTVRDTVYVDRIPPQTLPGEGGKKARSLDGYKPLFAFRTNILAIPLANVGLEIPLGKKVSIGLDAYYPWVHRDDAHMNCNQLLAADLELRYWFKGGMKSEIDLLTRHAVGIYGATGYYDFERSGFGHQGEFINIGVEYVYGLPLFHNRMHLEFELGLGFIYSVAQPYDCFVEGEKCYRRLGVKDYIRWWGPTRAQISIVVPIYGKIKKGGRQ